MKLGMFMMPLHPPHRALTDVYDEDMAKIIFADQIGMEEVWVGEHFSATTEPIAAAMIFLAAALPQTKHIKLGTGVVNLPNHNPLIVAAEAAQFDHMSKGRFMFGIGPGGLASDFEVFDNTDPKVREERMLDAFEAIKYIWTHDAPYDYQGPYYHVRIKDNIIGDMGIGTLHKPYQKPLPPVGLSVMSPFSGSAKRAALKGWLPISANFVPEYIVASHWTKYKEGCAEAKMEADGNKWRVSRNVIIADTDEEAQQMAFNPSGSTRYYFEYVWRALVGANFTVAMKPNPETPDDQVKIEDIIDALVIHGSEKTVTEKLAAFRDRVGPFGTLLLASMDGEGASGPAERKTMQILQNRILPKLG
ncbi:MAG: LLM class flavin-dependent oxidoreductase [Hyphomicrobiaceae bacterium]|nr:LLM class flavin-dependent oxidoreductase [Hyphomicrobiaceae bacterium]